ncbi:MAG: S9 family peptidase [Salinivirgaceae bacterium]|nr:S9 family peptidase [Salinivirgaceae bacterium]
MKHYFIVAVILTLAFTSCQNVQKQTVTSDIEFNIQLTDAEKANGVLTEEMMWKFGRVSNPKLSPDGKQILYTVSYYELATNKSRTSLFVVPADGGDAKMALNLAGSQFNQVWISSTEYAFISTHNGATQAYKTTLSGGSVKAITSIDGGIESFKISPDGNSILYAAEVKIGKDFSDTNPDLPLVNAKGYDDLNARHWNHWNDVSYSHIFVAPLSQLPVTKGTDIMENEAWDAPMSPYFDSDEIAWSSDSKSIAYSCKKIMGKDFAVSTNSDIYLYNMNSGETENLTSDNLGFDKYPSFSPDGNYMVWQSMETPGYEADKERLFIMNLNTKKPVYLTEHWDQNVGGFAWDSDSEKLFFISGINATSQIYSINIKTLEIEQYTKGHHDYTSVEVNGDLIVGSKMKHSMATEIFAVSRSTYDEKQLTFTNKPIYDNIEMGKSEERWITTSDGKKMLVWVIYPPKFDPNKKYPTLLYCQGGPQSTVSQFFSFRWNFQIMAAHDYIIVAPNRRGVPSFGAEWNAQISGDYSGQNIQDYLTAIDQIKKEPFVDQTKLGCVGASYGGYSVFYLAGHHEKRFKTFISHCGMYNLESFYGSTEETFFPNHDLGGPFWDKNNKIAQRSYANSPHKFVEKWDTPILIIHGGKDYRIAYTESLQAFTAARLRGLDSRFLLFPEETHFVLKPQNAVLWQREFFGWLDKYLK